MKNSFRQWLGLIVAVGLGIAACKRDDMADQPRVKPLASSSFFANGAAARVPPAHTVPVNALLEEESPTWQKAEGATRYPFEVTRTDLLRGQQQFGIFCAPCHGLVGDGEGMIPERGFTRPPSFHTDRLRNAPPSYVYDVITHGIGAMFPYDRRVSRDDRWRIVAYIKALQLSQNAPAEGGTP